MDKGHWTILSDHKKMQLQKNIAQKIHEQKSDGQNYYGQ